MIESSMKVIKPNPIETAMLTSSTRPETDHAAWSSGATYALGAYCIKTSTHRIYQSNQAGNLNHDPETAGIAWWNDVGPTNRWAMYDNVVGTVSAFAGNSMTDVLRPGSVSGLALLELVGTSVQIVMKDAPGGTVVYDRTIDLDETYISSFYEWFFTPFLQKTDVVLTDLPGHFASCELSITVNGISSVACGVCKMGDVIEIGASEYGAGFEINDYSRKKVDPDFGTLSLDERSFSKLISLSVLTEKYKFARIVRQLTSLRATLCIYIAVDRPGYEPMIVYGFFRSLRIVIPYDSFHKTALQIEGVI